MKPFAFMFEWEALVPQEIDIDEKIEFPVILREGNDITVLDDAPSILSSGIEAVDINSGEYVFYDKNGFAIDARVFGNVFRLSYRLPAERKLEEMQKYMRAILALSKYATAINDTAALINAMREISCKKTRSSASSNRKRRNFEPIVVSGLTVLVVNLASILFFLAFGGAAQYLLFRNDLDSLRQTLMRGSPATWLIYMFIAYAARECVLRLLLFGGRGRLR